MNDSTFRYILLDDDSDRRALVCGYNYIDNARKDAILISRECNESIRVIDTHEGFKTVATYNSGKPE